MFELLPLNPETSVFNYAYNEQLVNWLGAIF